MATRERRGTSPGAPGAAAARVDERGFPLVAPVAVRVIDLDRPLRDLELPARRLQASYCSLLAVARVGGDPVGAAHILLDPPGALSRVRLASELRSQLGGELKQTLRRRTLPPPTSLVAGIPARNRRRRKRVAAARSVSVVIPTCGDPVRLERCVRSILACDYDPVEIIVVENRPRSSASWATLRDGLAKDPRVRYVEEPARGASRARNTGLALAEGELIAFVDDDVVVDRAWLRNAVDAIGRADDVGCVTGLILPLELESESQLLLEQFACFGKGFCRRDYRLEEWRETHPLAPYTPGAVGSGANTVMRSDVARELGGFDTRLGPATLAAGAEDLDLYVRLLRREYAVTYEPSAIVWHEHPDGELRLRRQVYRYGLGLGALLTKQLVAGPERGQLVRAVPAGIRYARDPASRKNAGKPAGFPRHLEWLERLGMAVGPAAYLASAAAAGGRRALRGAVRGNGAERTARERIALSTGETLDVVDVLPAAPRRAVRLPKLRPAEAMSTPDRALVAGAAAACLVAALAVAVRAPTGLRFPAVLAMLCLAPGTALVQSLRGRLEIGLVLGTSLALSTLAAQSMLWLHAWHPEPLLYVAALICGTPLAARLARERRRPADGTVARLKRWLARALGARDGGVHAAILSVALGAWIVSLHGADLGHLSGVGLLGAMPPAYFLSFALLLAGFVLAVTRNRVSPALLGLYVLGLILVIHGTIPLLYDEPRYPWTYKHLGVIEFIAQGGRVDRNVDIYNNWPGFFAVNAWLRTVTGLAPSAYAPWAQVFFNVANVAVLRFAFRGVTTSERLIWTATLLFLLGNWVGQDYLAPQAFAFVVSLVIVGLCLRCAREPGVPSSRTGRWWTMQLGRLQRRLLRASPAIDERRAPVPLSARGALLVGAACYLAILVSHQLTPAMAIASVTALALVDRRVPLWVPAGMVLAEAGWVALAWPYVTDHFQLFSPGPGGGGAPPGYHLGDGLPGLDLVAYASAAEFLLLAGAGAIGLIRRLRAGHWDMAAVALILAPLLVVGVQSYAGEGRYRFFLFALPWLSFLAAAAVVPMTARREKRSPSRWRLAALACALGTCLLLAYFGLELSNRVTRADVDAVLWFERHAPRDSVLAQITGNSLARATARYAGIYDHWYPSNPSLTTDAVYRHRLLGRNDLPRIERTLRSYGGTHTFLILSGAQQRYARLYGALPARWRQSLEPALRDSRAFRLVYERGDSSIFLYKRARPRGSAQ